MWWRKTFVWYNVTCVEISVQSLEIWRNIWEEYTKENINIREKFEKTPWVRTWKHPGSSGALYSEYSDCIEYC